MNLLFFISNSTSNFISPIKSSWTELSSMWQRIEKLLKFPCTTPLAANFPKELSKLRTLDAHKIESSSTGSSTLNLTRNNNEVASDFNNGLIGYASEDKQQARDAVDILLQYKAKFGNFTDDYINNSPIAVMVMRRYQFSHIDELNNWLDGFNLCRKKKSEQKGLSVNFLLP